MRNDLLEKGEFIQIPGPNPILTTGPEGAWDDYGIETGGVLKDSPHTSGRTAVTGRRTDILNPRLHGLGHVENTVLPLTQPADLFINIFYPFGICNRHLFTAHNDYCLQIF